MSAVQELLYVGDQKKTVFFYDEDVNILRKIGQTILDAYESYQVVACDNLQDLSDELLESKPTVMILALSETNDKEFFDFIRSVRSNELIKKVPIIVLGNRGLLEKKSQDLGKWDVELVPKAIRVPFFMGVLAGCLSKAASVDVDVRNLSVGDHLFTEGDVAESLYIVKSGRFKIYREINGDVFNIAEIGDLEIIGEMSIVDNTPRSASAMAMTDCEVYVLNLGNIEAFLSAQPFWLSMILKSVILRLRQTNDKLAGR